MEPQRGGVGGAQLEGHACTSSDKAASGDLWVPFSVSMVREGDSTHQPPHLRHLRLHTAAVAVAVAAVARAQKACGVLAACADERT